MLVDQLPAATITASLSMTPPAVWRLATSPPSTAERRPDVECRPVAHCRSGESARQVAWGDIPLSGNLESRDRLRRQIRFFAPHLTRVEQRMVDTGVTEGPGGAFQLVRLVQRQSDLESAAPLVFDLDIAITPDTVEKLVVQREAANAQPAQRQVVAFDVGSEDAGRCACRAASRRTAVEDADVGAAGRELVGDGAADDARARDGDLHIAILVQSGIRG